MKSFNQKVTGMVIFHHEWKSLQEVVASFLKNYPHEKIFISRDTRNMMHEDLFRNPNIKFTKTYSSCQFLIDMAFDNKNVNDLNPKIVMQNMEQELLRMLEVVKRGRAEYLLYMQADSLIQKPFQFKEDFDMDTFNVNKYPVKVLDFIFKYSGKPLSVDGWGFVTHLAKQKKLVEIYNFFIKNQELMKRFFYMDARFAYSDYYFPILMHLIGGKLIVSRQVGEALRVGKYKRKQYAFLHQYRQNY